MTITKEWSAFVRRRQAPGGRTMLVLNQAARVCGLCLLLSQACSRIIRSGRERLGRFLSGGAAAAAGISYRGCNEPLAEEEEEEDTGLSGQTAYVFPVWNHLVGMDTLPPTSK